MSSLDLDIYWARAQRPKIILLSGLAVWALVLLGMSLGT